MGQAESLPSKDEPSALFESDSKSIKNKSRPRTPSPTVKSVPRLSDLLGHQEFHVCYERIASVDLVALNVHPTRSADPMLAVLQEGRYKIGRGTTKERLNERGFLSEPTEAGASRSLTADAVFPDELQLESAAARRRALSLFAKRAKLGLVLLAGDAKGLAEWARSRASKESVADVPDGRLFALVDGYLLALCRRGLGVGKMVSIETPPVSSAHKASSPRAKSSPAKSPATHLFSTAEDDDDEVPTEAATVWTVRDGEGCCVWLADGHYYVGRFEDDMCNGEGAFSWASGTAYNGQFRDELHHGTGVKTWANGDVYSGEWRDDEMHGQGSFTWVNGDKYVGGMHAGKRSGEGVFKYANGDFSMGAYSAGQKHGFSVFTYGMGSTRLTEQGLYSYTGEFERDLMHGHGTLEWVDGSVYVGQFANDQREGRGSMKLASDGSICEGEWKGGSCVSKVM